MTVKEREVAIRDILDNELIPLLQAKGHDYAENADCLSNFKDYGSHGVAVRLGDKYHRLKNFIKKGDLKVKDESIEDTVKDLINYSFFYLIMSRMEREQ